MVFVPCASSQNRYVGDLRETVAYLVAAKGMTPAQAMEHMSIPVADRPSILTFFDTNDYEASVEAAESGGLQVWLLDPAVAAEARKT